MVHWALNHPWECAHLMAEVVQILSAVEVQPRMDPAQLAVVSSVWLTFQIRSAQAKATTAIALSWMGSACRVVATKTHQGATFLVWPVQVSERASMSLRIQIAQVSCVGQ